MGANLLDFQAIDVSQRARVGGKGAHLGALAQLEGVQVPAGFCLTTEAFDQMLQATPNLSDLLAQLATVQAGQALTDLCADIHRRICAGVLPDPLRADILKALGRFGKDRAFAVRSSADAEDLPQASFAGQLDSFLNLIGEEAVLAHIPRCWASLFSERAVRYRLQNGFDPQQVRMAVVIQLMVQPDASGVLFTADPISGHRQVQMINACFGLGEALVAGQIPADTFRVQRGEVISRDLRSKPQALRAAAAGGTEWRPLAQAQQHQPALSDAQVLQLAALGRRVEAAFGVPQDIEWCLADGQFQLVQSRPITTLFPLPPHQDQELHVYVSVGHQQMMIDPIRPLGLSVFLMTTRAPMLTAGGRLFVDCTAQLKSPAARAHMLEMMGQGEPLMQAAIQTLLARDGLFPPGPDAPPEAPVAAPPDAYADILADLLQHSQAALARLKQQIHGKTGRELLDFIRADLQEQKLNANPQSYALILAGMKASTWLNQHIQAWLGDKNVVDVLIQSVPDNVTSEMGLALLDLADVIRPYPPIVAYLEHTASEDFLDGLSAFAGGAEVRAAFEDYLARYGMRCSGEIDITQPRWAEKPRVLLPMLLGHLRNFGPGASRQKFEHGRRQAEAKARELLTRLRALPDGLAKAAEAEAQIAILRQIIGYREYPKYALVSRYFVYRQALKRLADQLVRTGVLQEPEQMDYLFFEELYAVVDGGRLDAELIAKRRADYLRYARLMPPRVYTSAGESITGRLRHGELPAGALSGVPVSSGCVEGRARVVLRLEDADLAEGDILVTAYTDPSWTPLFVGLKGLVTEIGGTLTHGAVIAREYGLPAVVSVEQATRRIRDGQRIRVNGSEGYVELLD